MLKSQRFAACPSAREMPVNEAGLTHTVWSRGDRSLSLIPWRVPVGRQNPGYGTGEDRCLTGCTNLELDKSSCARKGRGKEMTQERLMRPREVANRLAVSRSTVYRWFWEGKLKGVKITGGTVRILESAVRDRMAEVY
jgi:excisionase family DNA binding protein